MKKKYCRFGISKEKNLRRSSPNLACSQVLKREIREEII